MKLTLLMSMSVVVLSGCMSLAPDFTRPVAPVPAKWEATPTSAADEILSAHEVPWREFFTEPRLQALIDAALENNRDLRVAGLNIERARALYRISSADLLPTIDAGANGNSQRVPGDLSGSGESMITRRYSASVGLTAFELDFFGRVRNLNQQALEEFLATYEGRRSAEIALVSEVARTWLALAADMERLDLARRTLETQRRSFDLAQRSFELGATSSLDLNQASTSVDRARADVARFTTAVAQGRNALALIVGAPVESALLPAALDEAAEHLAELPSDLSSEVLLRRPDITEAEHRLRGANASIGAARAAMFPRISLTASVGTASASLGDLFSSGSGTWAFVPQITLPIFDSGRLAANVRVSQTDRDIALARYEGAIQSAFREVADVLAERATIDELLEAQRSLVHATSETFRLSEARYRGGVDSYLGVLDAQRSLYAAQHELIGVRLADATSRVALYRVLGGGWR